jgi:hypothetical protein
MPEKITYRELTEGNNFLSHLVLNHPDIRECAPSPEGAPKDENGEPCLVVDLLFNGQSVSFRELVKFLDTQYDRSCKEEAIRIVKEKLHNIDDSFSLLQELISQCNRELRVQAQKHLGIEIDSD